MRILGLGTDIVEISRISDMLARHAENFLERTYTPDEIAYCAPKKNSAQHFAGRWAAKEAVMKAFGTGFVTGIHWTEIEVVVLKSGKPTVQLSATTAEFARQLGITEILLSISHGKEYAVATALACAN
ncbi:MAG: holo-ACP synthase [Planctomycetaceae bacterium]|nr:holo-ACP synthase [Planctomycetaceae bacterium]